MKFDCTIPEMGSLCTVSICCFERGKMVNPQSSGYINVFSIIFEVVSGYVSTFFSPALPTTRKMHFMLGNGWAESGRAKPELLPFRGSRYRKQACPLCRHAAGPP